jgi:hypothetical protein
VGEGIARLLRWHARLQLRAQGVEQTHRTNGRGVEGERRALLQWARRYNEHWLLQRHQFLSPSQARRELVLKQAA